MTKTIALCLSALLLAPALAQSQAKAAKPSSAGSAQRSKAAPSKKSARPASEKLSDRYSKVPFDPSIGKVPEGFRGHDLVSLYFALAGKLKGKGEFETTEAYNKRIDALMAEPVLGQLTPRSMLATVIGLTSGGEFSDLQYNADTQLLSVNKSLDKVPYGVDDLKAIDTRRVISTGLDFVKAGRTYVGQNAYGVKKRVVEKDEYICDLIMVNPGELGFKKPEHDFLGNEQNISFDLTMDPATAQKVKSNLKLLVLFQVGAPYVGISKDYDSATIDNPVDLTTHRFFIFARVSEVWLYDSRTGEVFAKFPAKAEGQGAASGS